MVNKPLKENRLLEAPESKEGSTLPAPKIKGYLPKLSLGHLKERRNKTMAIILGLLFILTMLGTTLSISWYKAQLQPVNSNATELRIVRIESGMTPGEIAKLLKDEGLIRSELAFDIYTRLHNNKNKLQAGVFSFSKKDSLEMIVSSLVGGRTATISVQFLPGDTLAKHKLKLQNLGYSLDEIEKAFNASYTGFLFEGKLEGSDLEGYIYPDTYHVVAGTSVEDILKMTFDEFTQVVEENNLKQKFANQGLSLYEGITLASIVEKEISVVGLRQPNKDQKLIAGLFFNRLRTGMVLGSDPTYQYIADKLGVPRSLDINSPYNTRKFAGLTPTPISSPGLTSLLAVANPTESDYLYFVSGDDGNTYYAKTDAEHQQNVAKYCHEKCKIL